MKWKQVGFVCAEAGAGAAGSTAMRPGWELLGSSAASATSAKALKSTTKHYNTSRNPFCVHVNICILEQWSCTFAPFHHPLIGHLLWIQNLVLPDGKVGSIHLRKLLEEKTPLTCRGAEHWSVWQSAHGNAQLLMGHPASHRCELWVHIHLAWVGLVGMLAGSMMWTGNALWTLYSICNWNLRTNKVYPGVFFSNRRKEGKKEEEFLYFVAIHFSVNRTLVRMIFCVWCYCNWVFWKRKETVFTEMCKFVAELTVKMRTPNCFCIWLVSSDVWERTNSPIKKTELWFSLGMVRTRLCECASQKWAANTGGFCCLLPGSGGVQTTAWASFISLLFSFVKTRSGEAAKYSVSVRSKSRTIDMNCRCKNAILKL